MMAILSAKQLQKSYKSRRVVKDVSLAITNEIVGLLGPNGAGKTTSFYMIVGLITPDSGEVFLDNQNISFQPMHKRARLGIGYLPQETSIFRKLSVAQNIMAILQLRNDLSKQQRQEKCESLMQEFHISHLRDIPGYSLSGGEKRRVEIARALAMDPKFILLDEPFAGIDPISVIDIKRIIIHLRERGIGILITDHNVRETLDICQRAYIVNDGAIIAHGTPGEILRNKDVRAVYLGDEFDLGRTATCLS
ncbi:ABC transporter, ATP-binding protein [Coxiella burnetii RSA 331]|uniref:Lipopolysaccharide export system ATP-binding protein LptB n=3 Tax=Coxiella burnetii TaxID=777 RepID=Q83DI5_COXBU|nr:LPS ABC transporter ATP-binding protein [Coxiella burnetii RSA 493]ABS78487.1 LPS ABC transporter ATP-binding protein [Coxiella burnetii Dugway 5J108-111]ABX78082.1 ABC transporter, ATP-binding protein [Coxiella burnetii RSA 331]ACJ18580.1 LPS ABC transporter ATP-binding protein [Coxiella burnetii CbuG_Q212]ARI65585.1 ABC transporter ATP-binding protein [Coxiella burnetii]